MPPTSRYGCVGGSAADAELAASSDPSAAAAAASGAAAAAASGAPECASGSRPMPDGRKQEPGGWNRIVLQVEDLPARIEALQKAGVHFRNQMEVGPGGRQIQIEDPDGNPIELFEPAKR